MELVEEWLDGYGRSFDHFIDGAWVAGADEERFETLSPATGARLATISQGSSQDVDGAVQAAAKAFPS